MNVSAHVKPKGFAQSCHGPCRACGSFVRTHPCPACKRIYCYNDCLPRHHFFEHVVKARKRLRDVLRSEGIL
jgi:hypothetical protein